MNSQKGQKGSILFAIIGIPKMDLIVLTTLIVQQAENPIVEIIYLIFGKALNQLYLDI